MRVELIWTWVEFVYRITGRAALWDAKPTYLEAYLARSFLHKWESKETRHSVLLDP